MGIKLPKKINKTDERSGMGFDIPNGTYLVCVDKCEKRAPKGGGDEYLHVELEILDAKADAGERCIGFRIFETFALTEKATWRVMAFLDACYPPAFEGDEIPDADIIKAKKRLVVKTKTEEYQGFERVRCSSIEALKTWKGVTMDIDTDGKVEYKGKNGPSNQPEKSSAKEEVVM